VLARPTMELGDPGRHRDRKLRDIPPGYHDPYLRMASKSSSRSKRVPTQRLPVGGLEEIRSRIAASRDAIALQSRPDHDRLGRRPTALRVSRGRGYASRNESVRQTTEAPTTRISPTRPRQMAASLTRSRAPFKLTLRVHRDPRDRPGAIPRPNADRKNHGRLPRPAGDHGRDDPGTVTPDQFDSTALAPGRSD